MGRLGPALEPKVVASDDVTHCVLHGELALLVCELSLAFHLLLLCHLLCLLLRLQLLLLLKKQLLLLHLLLSGKLLLAALILLLLTQELLMVLVGDLLLLLLLLLLLVVAGQRVGLSRCSQVGTRGSGRWCGHLSPIPPNFLTVTNGTIGRYIFVAPNEITT